MEYVKLFDDTLNDRLAQFVRKPTLIRGIVHLLLILYSARLAPTLPKPVLLLFENQYFKLFIFSLILWTAQFSPSTSILIALAFMVTVNYANQKPLWEFLENTESAVQMSAPEAPSKDMAVAATTSVVNAQVENAPVVTGVFQKEETIVVQPKIVETPEGPTVVNPTVVVAPMVVETPSGETVVVKPDVSTVLVDEQAAAAVLSAKQEAAASSMEVGPAPVVAEVPSIPVAPAVAPAPAPAPSPVASKEPQPEPAAFPKEGCYPVRKYDMDKVSPRSMDDYYSWSA